MFLVNPTPSGSSKIVLTCPFLIDRTHQRRAPQLFDSLHTRSDFCREELVIDTVTVPECETFTTVSFKSFSTSLAATAEPTAMPTTKQRTRLGTRILVTITPRLNPRRPLRCGYSADGATAPWNRRKGLPVRRQVFAGAGVGIDRARGVVGVPIVRAASVNARKNAARFAW